MTIKLISPNTLEKLRRGAEALYIKNVDKLSDTTVIIRHDIAKDLGITVKDAVATPVSVDNKPQVGIFDDEPKQTTIVPTLMTRVPLVAYIEALKIYDPTPTLAKPAAPAKGETK